MTNHAQLPAGPVDLPVFDFAAFVDAFDTRRRARRLSWYEFADELWHQSSQLNAQLLDHPLCGGAVSRLGARGETSCQYALFLLRWLHRAPEEFLTGPAVDVGDTRLLEPGPGCRLRWDLNLLHDVLNTQRQRRGLTWTQLARIIDCTPSRLTNLRTARMADLGLTMRVTQLLRRPAADFIQGAQW
ncbi:MAG TPA: hypothetical protein VH352_14380 [Pseudonocardiaceae bacterium]|nr:hypothetical protein [Pseudonocardiaceae bacterium]